MPGDFVKVQGGLTVLWTEWMLAGDSGRATAGHLNKAGLPLQLGKRQWSLESAGKGGCGQCCGVVNALEV